MLPTFFLFGYMATLDKGRRRAAFPLIVLGSGTKPQPLEYTVVALGGPTRLAEMIVVPATVPEECDLQVVFPVRCVWGCIHVSVWQSGISGRSVLRVAHIGHCWRGSVCLIVYRADVPPRENLILRNDCF